jgi:hypothetical protein
MLLLLLLLTSLLLHPHALNIPTVLFSNLQG